jgi:ferredoxin-type protein NapF
MIDKSKRNLFRRASSPFKSFIYPPYFEKKEDFLKCVECESKDCLSACNEKIIHIENDIPVIKFGINGCTFCDECAKACSLDVLKIENKKNRLNCEMIINPKLCIAWNQTICFSCQDICTESAIIYKGMFNPVIDLEKCSSCGFCISVCPTNAIEWKII